jgi:hypothetical protein
MSAAVTELGAHPLLRMTDFCSTNTLCRQDVWSHRSANIHLSRPCSRHSPPNGPLCARLPPSPYRTGRRLRDDQGNVQGLRIYISTPPGTKPGDDYLVDHSIFFYFMDPDGKFVDAFGKSSTEADVVERVKRELEE